VSLLNQI